MMVKILLYGYIVGIRSSRELEHALHEHVAFRFLGGGHFPNFRTIAAFRKRHFDDFSHLFSEVLQIAHKMGILQLGTVRLSVDGSKFKANASKLKNRVHKIVDGADKTDAKENTEQGKANDYINHPAENSEQDSPESQANKIKKAYQAIRNEEAGSKNPEKKTDSEVEGTEKKAKVLCSEQGSEQGSEQDGDQKDQQPPTAGEDGTPQPENESSPTRNKQKKQKKQKTEIKNKTDADSRLMKTNSTEGFQQAYNVQLGVDKKTDLMVGVTTTQAHNDQGQLIAMIDKVEQELGEPLKEVSADAGYSQDTVMRKT